MVDVTDADREAAERLWELVVLAFGDSDMPQSATELLAAYRIAGERAGLEKAAKALEDISDQRGYDSSVLWLAAAIRNLTPGDSQ